MNQDDIINMAQEAGHPCPAADYEFLLEFAKLVTVVERNACAKVCSDIKSGIRAIGLIPSAHADALDAAEREILKRSR